MGAMSFLSFNTGLSVSIPVPPPEVPEDADVVTEEAGVRPPPGQPPRVTPLVDLGQVVAQGAPVACLHDTPEVCFVAPMAGRVARINMRPGHRLSEIVLFRERGGDVATHMAADAGTEGGLRRLMQTAGFWPVLRRRPFGGMPHASERPAAIVVMAADTRPMAPDPRLALTGRQAEFERGLAALALLTEGPVFVCAHRGAPLFSPDVAGGRIHAALCGRLHPQGAAGLRIHDLAPATLDAPVWDIHAEDVANLGALLETGILPMRRLVSIGGPALRRGRLIWTHPGADLRGLTQAITQPGSHQLMSGSALDGNLAHWLATRDRQVTAMPRPQAGPAPHWLRAALTRSNGPRPVIPSAALDQAFGRGLPAAAFVRALGAGDDEGATRLGLLSLLEEDVALADYVLGGRAQLAPLLRAMLDRIQKEAAE